MASRSAAASACASGPWSCRALRHCSGSQKGGAAIWIVSLTFGVSQYELGSPNASLRVLRPRGDVSVLLGFASLLWGALVSVVVTCRVLLSFWFCDLGSQILEWSTWPTTAWAATWAHITLCVASALASLSVLANRVKTFVFSLQCC